MAKEIIEVECPNCGQTISVPTDEFVDVSETPEAKRAIIEGEFFLNECPECGDQVLVEYPMMYMDPEKKLNIYLGPDHDDDLLDQMNELELPPEAIDREAIFRLVSDGLYLVEKILIAEKNRDDRILELYKFVIWDQVEEVFPELEPGDLLYMFDDEEESFVVWPSDNGNDEKLTIPLDEELYQELVDNYSTVLAIPPGEYAEVDQEWIGERFER